MSEIKGLNLEGASPSNLLNTIHFPGWYRDVEDGICVIFKEHLVSIRFDKASKQYHVCADVLGPRGLWDKNVSWEATYEITQAKEYALDIIKRLAAGEPL